MLNFKLREDSFPALVFVVLLMIDNDNISLCSVEDDFEQAHLLVVAHNVLPGYWSPAHNLDESCAVNNTQVFYFIDPDTQ